MSWWDELGEGDPGAWVAFIALLVLLGAVALGVKLPV